MNTRLMFVLNAWIKMWQKLVFVSWTQIFTDRISTFTNKGNNILVDNNEHGKFEKMVKDDFQLLNSEKFSTKVYSTWSEHLNNNDTYDLKYHV